jgi:hypothetical protein
MRFLKRPQLALWNHRDGREDDRPILPALESQGLSSVALAQRDLAALAHDLDLDTLRDYSCRLFHAIMLSCRHADGKPHEFGPAGAVLQGAVRTLLTVGVVAMLGVSSYAADGVAGTWMSSAGAATKIYVFKMEGSRSGTVCGPCDDPSTVFRIADGTLTDGGRASFSIVGSDVEPASSTVMLKRVVGDPTSLLA